MTSLHHDRPVDDGRDVAPATPATTPAAARVTTRRRAGAVDGKVSSQVPQQRQGKASRTGSSADGSGRSTTRTGTAAGSLAARARAAAGSPAARSAAAKAVTAGTAAAKAASAGATTARTAAARATTAAKAAATTKAGSARAAATPVAAKAPAKPAAAKPAAAKAAGTKPAVAKAAAAKPAAEAAVKPAAAAAKKPAPATSTKAPAQRPTPRPRPRPTAAPAAVEAAPAAAVAVKAPVADVPAFVDEALAQLQADPAEIALATPDGPRRRTGRHRMPVVRRRSAFYVAAGLVGALSVGALFDTDPSARAEAPAVAETVSVAEQLGIEAEPTTALADAESTRLLQELVASRNDRDAASTAAADAQNKANFFAMTAYAQAAAEAARPKAVLPINGARLTSGFGARWGTVHAGIDLAAPMRTPEYAAMDGVVLEAGPASGFGLAVYIQHDNGDVTVYGHMDEILVEPGQVVRAGDTIALLGNRGQSTGPHLHFEVHVGGLNGTKVDPIPWLRERGIQI
jgi:murein DD-endopeptidase MepM/ murein hydrolase activator NlpD